MTIGDALAAWLIVTTGGAILLAALTVLGGLVRDVLAYLRERRTPPCASPMARTAPRTWQPTGEDVADELDQELAVIFEPFRRRAELRALPGGRDPRSAA